MICMLICRTYRANLQDTVHLTDLGPEAAPDNERQAPYSNVGQVSTIWLVPRWQFSVLTEQQAVPY